MGDKSRRDLLRGRVSPPTAGSPDPHAPLAFAVVCMIEAGEMDRHLVSLILACQQRAKATQDVRMNHVGPPEPPQ